MSKVVDIHLNVIKSLGMNLGSGMALALVSIFNSFMNVGGVGLHKIKPLGAINQ